MAPPDAGTRSGSDARPRLDAVSARLAAAGCIRAEEEALILLEAARTPEELDALVTRRAAGEPLEHLVGWAAFRGLRLRVDAGVFVPRFRSGFLVEEVASVLRQGSGPGRGATVVDLCCGVGAIGAALAAEVPGTLVHAGDADPRAIACARHNLAPWGGQVHEGDLLAALPEGLRGRVDVLVASPPYVPTDAIRLLAAEAREHEALLALDGGPDGLEVVRRIARGAGPWLKPGGRIALEVGESQVEAAAAVLADHGYEARAAVSEEYGSAVATGRTGP